MKIRLIENDKTIEVPDWNYHIIDGQKVIKDQSGEVIAIVVEE